MIHAKFSCHQHFCYDCHCSKNVWSQDINKQSYIECQLPVWHKSITWTNDDFLSTATLRNKLQWNLFKETIVFSCDQAALWMAHSVRPSVCPSVTPFSPCSHHRIIMKFSGVITNDKSDVHANDQGQRSKVKVTEAKTQFSHFRTITPVWIHIWWQNDAQILMLLRRGALLLFKVIHQISRSHGTKIRPFWAEFSVSRL